MHFDEDEYLEHYGVARRSGRYEWGSGGNVPSSGRTLLQQIEEMRGQGLNDHDIYTGLGMTSTEFRDLRTIANAERKREQIAFARALRDKGTSHKVIGERMGGVPESQVRALLKDGEEEKAAILHNVANVLRSEVNEKGMIDVGEGVEQHLNVTETKLRAAVTLLKSEGYTLHNVKSPQTSNTNFTNTKVLAGPGVTKAEVYKNLDKVHQVLTYFEDGGRTALNILPPMSIDPSRVKINYGKDGGDEADGVIFVRPGVDDISLGGGNYAQVRVKVGDTHYLKGMALYKKDLPEGADLVFNTNKSDTGDKFDAMKPLKDDNDNPFGAQISRQISKHDENGNQKLTSVMNLVNEEGDWAKWKRTLSSQILSKQKPELVKEQLDLAHQQRTDEFERLSAITNPTIRKKLLENFGDEASLAAVQLRAAALPRQGSHVILPLTTIKEDQIYAPGFNAGERVVLIRHPHGGRFEIPELTVNNRLPEGKEVLGNSPDAVGIHANVAKRLSGADFDGDVVLVIPNNKGKILTNPALESLKDFDPKQFKLPDDAPKMKESVKQLEMGKASNLITDMTIKGAPFEEIARAVKHSMVVIDAVNHHLDYKLSAQRHGIAQLKDKYQGGPKSGAATLISRAKSEQRVDQRTPRPGKLGGPIDKETGKRVFIEKPGARYVDAKGVERVRTQASTKLKEVDDAFELSSGTKIENLYAEHSNRLKALGNQARLVSVNTPNAKHDPSATKVYEAEVSSLNHKLALADRNKPLERIANRIANAKVKAIQDSESDIDSDTLKKIKTQALAAARARVGASGSGSRIKLDPREWEAIQAGALHDSRVKDILASADLDNIKEFAIPKESRLMTPSKIKRAQLMLDAGYPSSEIAQQLGVSISTLTESTGPRNKRGES